MRMAVFLDDCPHFWGGKCAHPQSLVGDKFFWLCEAVQQMRYNPCPRPPLSTKSAKP